MRIALCSYSQKEKETALLMKLGKVDRFDNGVFCTYAMQRDGPYDAEMCIRDSRSPLYVPGDACTTPYGRRIHPLPPQMPELPAS